MTDGVIPCHTCGGKTKLARSVLLRICDDGEIERARKQWRKTFALDLEDFEHEHKKLMYAYDRYEKNQKHRRTFVCERCYKGLDCFTRVAMALFVPGQDAHRPEWVEFVPDADGQMLILSEEDAEKVRTSRTETYSIDGRSCEGKAAVYDYKKWVSFQRCKAKEMGIELPRN